jgi:hypothetical protein
LCSFGAFFPVLVSCTKKNLASLPSDIGRPSTTLTSVASPFCLGPLLFQESDWRGGGGGPTLLIQTLANVFFARIQKKRKRKKLDEKFLFLSLLANVLGAKHKCCRLKKIIFIRVARFFLVHDTKTGKNVENKYKMYQMAIKYPKSP